MFDRGGEEALFLHEQGVPFEVVPGIPAAIGIPSYAGVPITYPGGGDTVTLVRGHEDESQTAPQVDWASLAKLKGTIVCYAGTRQLPAILDAIRGPDAAVGQDKPANRHRRRTSPGPREARRAGRLTRATGLPSGDPRRRTRRRAATASRWFDDRPLFGKRIVVTRPRKMPPICRIGFPRLVPTPSRRR